ncbi:MAG TPA: T9SS type A sorting domain-containing protein [Cytophagales bacterium]|nr:T9SS type A sorting domain-containing protein [Cytophagales bacterium]
MASHWIKKYYYSDLALGLDDTQGLAFSWFPNPCKDQINFVDLPANSGLEILDAKGMVVFKTLINNDRIDVSNLKPGPYHVRIFSTLGTSISKILIE